MYGIRCTTMNNKVVDLTTLNPVSRIETIFRPITQPDPNNVMYPDIVTFTRSYPQYKGKDVFVVPHYDITGIVLVSGVVLTKFNWNKSTGVLTINHHAALAHCWYKIFVRH